MLVNTHNLLLSFVGRVPFLCQCFFHLDNLARCAKDEKERRSLATIYRFGLVFVCVGVSLLLLWPPP